MLGLKPILRGTILAIRTIESLLELPFLVSVVIDVLFVILPQIPAVPLSVLFPTLAPTTAYFQFHYKYRSDVTVLFGGFTNLRYRSLLSFGCAC